MACCSPVSPRRNLGQPAGLRTSCLLCNAFYRKKSAIEMKSLPKEKRDRLILIVIGTLGCMLAIWFGLVRAQNKSLENIARKSIEQQNKVGNAVRLVGSTAEIQKKLEACPMTRRPAAVSLRTVSATARPPSNFTAAAPPSWKSLAALRVACSAEI